ncbi:metallophosphoesterase [Streptomyces sp. NPDC002476]|uniref:metallophosphoesterase n=1 Tax=Streptomyces sp. NPDC002476 TaxID=3364648 RepID=UPI00369D856F
MTVAGFALVVLVVLALLAGVHRYLWQRLVGDTTTRGSALRRAGTVAAYLLPLLSIGALVAGRVGAPFPLQQALAWPGYLWLAAVLYLTLALLVGEAVRPVLRRVLARRDAVRGRGDAVRGRQEGRAADEVSRGGAADAGGAPAASAASVAASPAAEGPLAAASPVTQAPSAVMVADGDGDGGSAAARTDSGAAGTGTETGTDTNTNTDTDTDTGSSSDTDSSSGTDSGTDSDSGTGTETGTGTAAPAAVPVVAAALTRRLFVARAVGGAAAVAGLGTVGHGTYGVLRGPRVKRVAVPLARLPRSAHGFRIAVVSDIHLGPILGRAHTQRIVDTVNRTRPDLVAVVGDLVDGTVDDLGAAAEPLAGLDARQGSFFVTGNHEYYSGAAQWVDHVRELGLHPLENTRVEIDGFDLAGVNDIAGEAEGQGPDFEAALGDRDPARASVLLAHQPVVIDDAVAWGVDLQLSGHTHGGQLWPGNLVAGLANPTVAGLDRYGDTQLYVTRGAGAWGPPVRVGAPSDITVVELASPQA